MGQISEYCTVNDDDFTMHLSNDCYAQFDSLEELNEGIKKYFEDCDEFVKVHGGMDSWIIEKACFPQGLSYEVEYEDY